MVKIKSARLDWTKVGYPAIILLMLALFAVVNPVYQNTYAEQGTDSVTTYASVDVLPAISLSIPNMIQIVTTPTQEGVFSSSTETLTVATNSSDGYALYMESKDGSSQLKSGDNTNSAVIGPVSVNATAENFGANTWGYSLDSKTFQPVPTSSTTPIKRTTSSSSKDEYNLTFGAYVDSSLPVGEYSNAVVISAVANPITVTSLQQVTYMQNLTPQICKDTAVDVTKQLVDMRDGNKYWVAKLRDGNCWMTQNLALDLTSKGLSPQDSDILAEWNSRAAYPPTDTNSIELIGKSAMSAATATGFWNIGKVVLAMPKLAKLCKNYGGSDAQWSLKTTDNVAKKCALSGFVDVSGDNWQPTFTATIGNITLEGSDGSGVSYFNEFVAVQPNDPGDLSQGGKYDAHYLIGNYYQFNAALAGSVVFTSNYNSSESICPKNWKLPQNSNNNVTLTTSGTWQYLLSQYGLVTNLTSGKLSNTEYDIASAPFYFVRSGYANPASSAGYFNRIGSHAALWSGTANSSNNGYMSIYSPTNAYLLYNSNELSAGAQSSASVRCVLISAQQSTGYMPVE